MHDAPTTLNPREKPQLETNHQQHNGITSSSKVTLPASVCLSQFTQPLKMMTPTHCRGFPPAKPLHVPTKANTWKRRSSCPMPLVEPSKVDAMPPKPAPGPGQNRHLLENHPGRQPERQWRDGRGVAVGQHITSYLATSVGVDTAVNGPTSSPTPVDGPRRTGVFEAA